MNKKYKNLDLMAGVSHEIRNPLNAIIGISHLLKNVSTKAERNELIETLLQSSEDLLELTNNILDFSKLRSGKLTYNATEVDLRKKVERGLFAQKSIAEAKGLQLVIDIEEAVPQRVLIDTVKFNQIIINLVSNAIKFTSKGQVRVHIGQKAVSETEVVLDCAVIDTGKGIPEDQIERILEPFNQGEGGINRTYGGTGLGLSISHELIIAMGGELCITSNPGCGSEFRFCIKAGLPQETEAVAAPEKAAPVNPLQEGINVLVADDNELNLLVATKNLQRWNIDHEVARDGEEALEKVQQQDFDIVFMDLHMPTLDGFDATCAIRTLEESYFKKLPIIALSASTEIREQEELKATGFTDFLVKPFKPQDFLDKILQHTSINVEKQNVQERNAAMAKQFSGKNSGFIPSLE